MSLDPSSELPANIEILLRGILGIGAHIAKIFNFGRIVVLAVARVTKSIMRVIVSTVLRVVFLINFIAP